MNGLNLIEILVRNMLKTVKLLNIIGQKVFCGSRRHVGKFGNEKMFNNLFVESENFPSIFVIGTFIYVVHQVVFLIYFC